MVYADQYWPHKPIAIPANPSIKFEHTIKQTHNKTQSSNLADLMQSMRNPVRSEDKEEYTNSAILTYLINGKESSIIVHPGDWVVVYTDGMVVIKQQEQFIREYNEYSQCTHETPRVGSNEPTVPLRKEESSGNANVDDTVHNAPS